MHPPQYGMNSVGTIQLQKLTSIKAIHFTYHSSNYSCPMLKEKKMNPKSSMSLATKKLLDHLLHQPTIQYSPCILCTHSVQILSF
ncbi:hypothetical protein ACS0TY_027451 [Phlomoides rotata]